MSANGNSSAKDGDPSSGSEKSEGAIQRNLTFWKNGFQLDDGELRRYEDPANARILNAIQAGNVPPSIFNVQPGQKVELKVTNHINEDFVPSESDAKASTDAEK
ncbi:SEP domain-containing protein [Panaeolus papilionaceus]|nr:SEP domain-containing protein [Panaeolus papilionaceus]